MGGSATKSEQVLEPTNPNGNTIQLVCKICASWGFNGKVDVVKSTVVQPLLDKGYKVKIDFEPVSNDRGAWYLYRIDSGKEILVFSNNKGKHGSYEKVIFDSKINAKVGGTIVQALSS